MSGPLNGIPATMTHGEGAIARCSYCRRYTLNPHALGDRQPVCDCGERHGWSGSFVRPGPDAQWSGERPAPAVEAGPPTDSTPPADAASYAARVLQWRQYGDGMHQRAMKAEAALREIGKVYINRGATAEAAQEMTRIAYDALQR